MLGELGNGGPRLIYGLYGVPSARGAYDQAEGRTMFEFRKGYIEPPGELAVILAQAVPICEIGSGQWLWLDCADGGDGVVLLLAGIDLYRTDLSFRAWWSAWLHDEVVKALFDIGPPRVSENPFTREKVYWPNHTPRGVKIHTMTFPELDE